MPIRIDADLPAKKILERENIFVMDYVYKRFNRNKK